MNGFYYLSILQIQIYFKVRFEFVLFLTTA